VQENLSEPKPAKVKYPIVGFLLKKLEFLVIGEKKVYAHSTFIILGLSTLRKITPAGKIPHLGPCTLFHSLIACETSQISACPLASRYRRLFPGCFSVNMFAKTRKKKGVLGSSVYQRCSDCPIPLTRWHSDR
jgi:hypothetical protein